MLLVSNLPQPILLGVPNEVALLNKKDTTEKMEEFLNKVNSGMDNYKKIEKVVFVKDEWTPDNNLTTPTLRLNVLRLMRGSQKIMKIGSNMRKHSLGVIIFQLNP